MKMPPDVRKQYDFFCGLASDPACYQGRMGKLAEWLERELASTPGEVRMLTDGEFEAACGRFHHPGHVRAAIRKFAEVNGLHIKDTNRG
jgi:hypothetical protein